MNILATLDGIYSFTILPTFGLLIINIKHSKLYLYFIYPNTPLKECQPWQFLCFMHIPTFNPLENFLFLYSLNQNLCWRFEFWKIKFTLPKQRKKYKLIASTLKKYLYYAFSKLMFNQYFHILKINFSWEKNKSLIVSVIFLYMAKRLHNAIEKDIKS